MESFSLKNKKQEAEVDDCDDINDRISERSSSVASFKTFNEPISSNSWKIKANIENRNFLIPIKFVFLNCVIYFKKLIFFLK